jgi:hypothetical protein
MHGKWLAAVLGISLALPVGVTAETVENESYSILKLAFLIRLANKENRAVVPASCIPAALRICGETYIYCPSSFPPDRDHQYCDRQMMQCRANAGC